MKNRRAVARQSCAGRGLFALLAIALVLLAVRPAPAQEELRVRFSLDRAIDGAARDVQAAINASRALLPANLPNNPTYRKVNPAEGPVMVLALTSATLGRAALYD